MNIDEAIKTLTDLNVQNSVWYQPRCVGAIQLGIEALKAIQATREPHSRILPSYLPGETEE